MNPDNGHEEIKKLLVENQRLLLENNQMLHKMRRSAFLGTIFRIVWFLVILGVPVYLYFSYVKPNMDNLLGKYNALEEAAQNSTVFKDWYNSLQGTKAE